MGSGIENVGSGIENLGSGIENLGSGIENLGPGIENLASGIDNVGSGIENVSTVVEPSSEQAEEGPVDGAAAAVGVGFVYSEKEKPNNVETLQEKKEESGPQVVDADVPAHEPIDRREDGPDLNDLGNLDQEVNKRKRKETSDWITATVSGRTDENPRETETLYEDSSEPKAIDCKESRQSSAVKGQSKATRGKRAEPRAPANRAEPSVPASRVTRSQKREKKKANSKKSKSKARRNGILERLDLDGVSVAASNIYDRVKRRRKNGSESSSAGRRVKVRRPVSRGSQESREEEGAKAEDHVHGQTSPDNEAFERESNTSLENEVLLENDLIIEVKSEVKLENGGGDDTDDTKSYLDEDVDDIDWDDDNLGSSVSTTGGGASSVSTTTSTEDPAAAPKLEVGSTLGEGATPGDGVTPGDVATPGDGSTRESNQVSSYLHSKKWVTKVCPTGEMVLISEDDYSSLSGNSMDEVSSDVADVKPDVSKIDGRDEDPGAADGQSDAAASDDTDNTIVTLCYFCLSETVFFDGTLDNFRSHLWQHLIEYDTMGDCPLECEESFDGNFRKMAIHFFEKHQYLPVVDCEKCYVRFVFDFELASHECSSLTPIPTASSGIKTLF